MDNRKKVEWYDNPNLIINLMIGLLGIAVLVAQTIAIRMGLSFQESVNQLFNDSSVYLFYLVYFILINLRFGKKHFDALSIVAFIFQSILLLTSLLNIIQTIGIKTIFEFILSIGMWLYISNSLIRTTKIWNDFNLDLVPTKFFKNIDYFYIVTASSLIILVIGLIDSFDFNYVLVILLDCLVYIGIARYLYLYRKYNEEKKNIKKIDKEITIVKKKVKKDA